MIVHLELVVLHSGPEKASTAIIDWALGSRFRDLKLRTRVPIHSNPVFLRKKRAKNNNKRNLEGNKAKNIG